MQPARPRSAPPNTQHDQWDGPFPAYGLFGRHVRGLKLANERFTLTLPDARPAIVGYDSNA